MSKYGNQKTVVDGIEFDSRREARRWRELKWLEKAGEIRHLDRQVSYELIPAIRSEETGKVIQRGVSYIADFVYQTVPEGTASRLRRFRDASKQNGMPQRSTAGLVGRKGL